MTQVKRFSAFFLTILLAFFLRLRIYAKAGGDWRICR